MADLELNNPEFEITVSLSGEEKTIRVQPAETSDGVEYYKCNDGSAEITQIRKEEDGQWEQLWGDLEQQEIDLIGAAIAQKPA
ncbi:hypothetical protein ACSBL2_04830 [Pedobacter sp. AW31-3R]|uniref:hypothetical protein n=1 Tax=Pedobacter sp. AW31-3R TaxID=3445781 RepID=UPI003FA03F60